MQKVHFSPLGYSMKIMSYKSGQTLMVDFGPIVRTSLMTTHVKGLHQNEEKTEIEMSHCDRKRNSAIADGGPRSRVCARETLRSAPHRH